MAEMEAAVDELAERFLGRSGIVAISDDRVDDHDVIVVLVSGDVQAVSRIVPHEWRGLRVLVKASAPLVTH